MTHYDKDSVFRHLVDKREQASHFLLCTCPHFNCESEYAENP